MDEKEQTLDKTQKEQVLEDRIIELRSVVRHVSACALGGMLLTGIMGYGLASSGFDKKIAEWYKESKPFTMEQNIDRADAIRVEVRRDPDSNKIAWGTIILGIDEDEYLGLDKKIVYTLKSYPNRDDLFLKKIVKPRGRGALGDYAYFGDLYVNQKVPSDVLEFFRQYQEPSKK